MHSTLQSLSQMGTLLTVHNVATGLDELLPWEDAVVLCALSPGVWDADTKAVFAAFATQYRAAHERLELQVQARALDQCNKSTNEVRELLVGLNSAPFVIEPRSAACMWRIKLRGGVLGAFGYQFRASQVPACLLCGEQGKWTIPHLVRDCTLLETERMAVWGAALAIGVGAGVMANRPPASDRHNWYLLTVGACVPETFCRVGTSAPTHFNRPEGATATRRHGKTRGLYLKLLRVTGDFLVGVMTGCMEAIKQCLDGHVDAAVNSPSEDDGVSERKDDMPGDDNVAEPSASASGSDADALAFLDSEYEDNPWESIDEDVSDFDDGEL